MVYAAVFQRFKGQRIHTRHDIYYTIPVVISWMLYLNKAFFKRIRREL